MQNGEADNVFRGEIALSSASNPFVRFAEGYPLEGLHIPHLSAQSQSC